METTLAERIKELRKNHHLTQEEFGERVGVQKSGVCKWEKGKVDNISRVTIERICEAFNVTPQWLLGMEEPSRTITEQVAEMLDRLNEDGQEKVLEYVQDLVASGRYSLKCNQSQVV